MNPNATALFALALAQAACLCPAQGRPGPSAADAPRTKVLVFFDTEDFTSDRANDPVRDLANLCTEEG